MTMERTLDPTCTQLDQGLRVRGVWIMAIFAVIWSVVAASGLSEISDLSAWALPSAVVAVGISVALLALGHRSAHHGALSRPRHLPDWWAKAVGWVNIAQLVAIAASVSVLARSGHAIWIPPVIAVIVGLHFVPLAPAFDQHQYRWMALLLVVVGALGAVLVVLGAEDVAVQAAVGYASALVLWGCAWHVGTRG